MTSTCKVSYVNNIEIRRFGTDKILDDAAADGSLQQLEFAANLPGAKLVVSMPDCHQGYTFPIGSVVAVDAENGNICPGGIGFDIGCGMKVITTALDDRYIQNHKDKFAHELSRSCPAGVYSEGNSKLGEVIDQVLLGKWSKLITDSLGDKDFINCEDQGSISTGVDTLEDLEIPERIVNIAKKQLGSLGSGNHFAEVDVVTTINNQDAADAYGLKEHQIVIQIHCGSRGFGYKLCDLSIKAMAEKTGLEKNKESAHVPIKSEEGQRYLKHMNAAANFAFMNRYVLGMNIRKAIYSTFGFIDTDPLYDLMHNIAKRETHRINSQDLNVYVMRKGATRAMGPSSDLIPEKYSAVGQPVLVPGSMGSNSYILAGSDRSASLSLSSSCHGAGRAMGRKASSRLEDWQETERKLQAAGIIIHSANKKELSEERPEAYKDVSEVVNVIDSSGIASIVATLSPLIVIKG